MCTLQCVICQILHHVMDRPMHMFIVPLLYGIVKLVFLELPCYINNGKPFSMSFNKSTMGMTFMDFSCLIDGILSFVFIFTGILA